LSASPRPDALPTSAFDYALPASLIAREPAARRDASRLLVVHRATRTLEHRVFGDVVALIAPGDVLVVNETRVIPARLVGRRSGGGRAEVLLLRPCDGAGGFGGAAGTDWEALVRPGRRLRPGAAVTVADDLTVEIGAGTGGGVRRVRLRTPDVATALARHGRVPLPPYIDREPGPADAERYQTVYARKDGSVAAPTAGLHFTPALLDALAAAGVRIARIVLHVGAGTFRPVEVEDPAQHAMHPEWYSVDAAAADVIGAARGAGRAVWAVGTTVARTLETIAAADGSIAPAEGWTRLFIRPPYRFRAVDRLITNFHLPRSTLLMLVSAFAGHDLVMRAYAEAVARRYRFYSYGDAMALV
jgi:S-adenosylmethionine:tRNA ribosyltransferase-isomerase